MQLTSKLARVNVKLSYDNERYLFGQIWGKADKSMIENRFEQ